MTKLSPIVNVVSLEAKVSDNSRKSNLLLHTVGQAHYTSFHIESRETQHIQVENLHD
jgi:hypothetical protein